MTASAFRRPQYRLYIDEVGNEDMRQRDGVNERYLSLTGIAISLNALEQQLRPAMEGLRELVRRDPDEPVILHRKELCQRKYPFTALKDDAVGAEFDERLLALIENTAFTVFSVTIDKYEHYEKYATWKFHPYHYCLHVLLERYVGWLGGKSAVGDVMAEARSKKKDKQLKSSFRGCVLNGTNFVEAAQMQQQLTSGEIKLKPKSANVDGLQLGDMIAYPSFRHMRALRLDEDGPGRFSAKIAAILDAKKYHRSPYDGHIDGYGRKWLP